MRIIECPLARRAARLPDAAAIITDEAVVSNAQLDELVASAVDQVRRDGLTAGDRLVVNFESSIDSIVLLIALLRIGAATIHVGKKTPDRVIFELARTAATDLVATDRSVARGLTRLSCEPQRLTSESTTESSTWDLDSVATLVSTSGSQGAPRLAALTVQNHILSAAGAAANMPLQRGNTWLLSLPLNHVSGQSIIFRSLLSGAAVAIASPDVAIVNALESLRPSHVSVVETQLADIISGIDTPGIRSLTAILAGGGPIADRLIDRSVEARLPLFRTYGLTEMTSQVTTTKPGARRDELATSGSVLAHRQVKITNEGEIAVKGETLFAGFFDNGMLSRGLDADGWYATSDCGYVDESGRLVVTGRRDNMFISGGENVHPEEIERILMTIPSVQNAAVAPVHDARFGRLPIAFVKLAGTGDIAQIAALAATSLPPFMRPDQYFDWPQGVETSMGKIDRARLQKEAEQAYSGS